MGILVGSPGQGRGFAGGAFGVPGAADDDASCVSVDGAFGVEVETNAPGAGFGEAHGGSGDAELPGPDIEGEIDRCVHGEELVLTVVAKKGEPTGGDAEASDLDGGVEFSDVLDFEPDAHVQCRLGGCGDGFVGNESFLRARHHKRNEQGKAK